MAKNKFMHSAIKAAFKGMGQGAGGPFGAVVVKDGEIIAEGWNCVTSKNDPTAHAEIVAIRKACEKLGSFQLTGCEVYSSCEPCPMCLGALYWARPDRLYFAANRTDAAQAGFDDDFIYKEITYPIQDRSLPTEQMMHTESLDVFKDWISKTDKIRY